MAKSSQWSLNLPRALKMPSQSLPFLVDSSLWRHMISALLVFLENRKFYFARTKWNRRPKRVHVCVLVGTCAYVCVSVGDIVRLDLVVLPGKRGCPCPPSSSDQTLQLDPVVRGLQRFSSPAAQGWSGIFAVEPLAGIQEGTSGRH